MNIKSNFHKLETNTWKIKFLEFYLIEPKTYKIIRNNYDAKS